MPPPPTTPAAAAAPSPSAAGDSLLAVLFGSIREALHRERFFAARLWEAIRIVSIKRPRVSVMD